MVAAPLDRLHVPRRGAAFYGAAAVAAALVVGGFFVSELFEVLSVILLAAIAVVCWRIFELRRMPGASWLSGTARIWLLIALGFAYLALDDALSLHENIDRLIHWLFSIEETRFTDRIDDLIVFAYGIAGLVLLYLHRSEFRPLTGYMPYFVLGFALLLVMVLLDLATNRADFLLWAGVGRSLVPTVRYWLEAGEEIAKLLAEAAFLLGFLRIHRQVEGWRPAAPATPAD